MASIQGTCKPGLLLGTGSIEGSNMRAVKILGILLVLLAVGIQFLPFSMPKTNPPITGEPQWDSPETEKFARRACFDCHSNETKWPWYASVAPISWRVTGHVDHARRELNFSEFDKPQKEAHESAEEVEKGKMPPSDYLRMHPEARLTEEEKAAFIRGLKATFGESDEDH